MKVKTFANRSWNKCRKEHISQTRFFLFCIPPGLHVHLPWTQIYYKNKTNILYKLFFGLCQSSFFNKSLYFYKITTNSLLKYRRWTKSKKPLLQKITHHRQNPLDFKTNVAKLVTVTEHTWLCTVVISPYTQLKILHVKNVSKNLVGPKESYILRYAPYASFHKTVQFQLRLKYWPKLNLSDKDS
jgi:hypothetical protein